jgi:hypothetical protein
VRDLRAYRRQSNLRYIAGMLLLLFVLGEGLIYWLYGGNAALLGLLCLLGGLVPLGLIYLAFQGLDLLLKKLNEE